MLPEIAIALALLGDPTACNCGGTRVMCQCTDCKCTTTYADFLARVEKLQPGQYLTLTVGQPGDNRCDDAKTFGIDAGRYSCWLDGGIPKMRRIEPPATINANATNNAIGTSPSVITGQILQLGSPCANGRCPTPTRGR